MSERDERTAGPPIAWEPTAAEGTPSGGRDRWRQRSVTAQVRRSCAMDTA
jgi:hypothetical protein